MVVNNIVIRNRKSSRYELAMQIRQCLTDGRVWTVGEVARELGSSYQQIQNALTSLTNLEPTLAEEDDGAVFMVIGG